MEWDTGANETDGTEDDIDLSTSDDARKKRYGTWNIPWSSIAKSIKVSSFVFGMSCDFAVPLTLSIQYLDFLRSYAWPNCSSPLFYNDRDRKVKRKLGEHLLKCNQVPLKK